MCGKPGKGVLHDDDPHFSELFEGLKNASACRKDFFDTLTWPSPAFAGEGHTADAWDEGGQIYRCQPYCGCVGVSKGVKSTAARQGNAAATSGMTGSFQGVAVVQDGDTIQKQHILILENRQGTGKHVSPPHCWKCNFQRAVVIFDNII